MTFAGIDVGGRRKGFHVAAVLGKEVVSQPQQLADVEAVMTWLRGLDPKVVALDSPRTCAPPGDSSRLSERELMKAICGIRWTPEESRLDGNPYYEWVRHGFELYAALEQSPPTRGIEVIEVFPTASWTVWAGPRGKQTRARWTQQALEQLKLAGLAQRRLNQDDRDRHLDRFRQ